jgi:hypothetical protein
MAKLIWALLCRRIILDRETNLVSYVDALDGLSIVKFPAASPTVFVGTSWLRGDEERLEMNVVIYGPDGSRLDAVEADPIVFEPQHNRGRMNIVISSFPITSPGTYHLAIETKAKSKWQEVHRFPLNVEARVQPREETLVKAPPKKRSTVARSSR